MVKPMMSRPEVTMTGTNTQKHLQWVIESGAALVVVGVGLNALVMKTLGSFDAATVILALILGFWAFVLGNTVLFLSSIWVFMRRREMRVDRASGQPEVQKRLESQPLRPTEPCRGY
jgi:hypothetical protein